MLKLCFYLTIYYELQLYPIISIFLAMAMAATVKTRRGLFIVIEGCDRSGKTIIAQRLHKELFERFTLQSKTFRFPHKDTMIGQVLHKHLSGVQLLDGKLSHLLFAANRWEQAGLIKHYLERGLHVIVDRYSYSGAAFSNANYDLNLKWCMTVEADLPAPDCIIYLHVSHCEAIKRHGFGPTTDERKRIQDAVRTNFFRLMDPRWKYIDTDQVPLDDVFTQVLEYTLSQINTLNREPFHRPIASLWNEFA